MKKKLIKFINDDNAEIDDKLLWMLSVIFVALGLISIFAGFNINGMPIFFLPLISAIIVSPLVVNVCKKDWRYLVLVIGLLPTLVFGISILINSLANPYYQDVIQRVINAFVK